MSAIRHPVLRFLIFGHVWLALGAAAQVWWMCFLLRTDPTMPMSFAAIATFSAYGWMRLMRMNVSELQGSGHMAWFRMNRWVMFGAVVVSGVVSIMILYPMLPRMHPVFWVACACAVLYVLPGSTKAHQVRGLRRIPVLKSLFIAFAWAGLTVSIALTGDDNHVRTQVLQLLAIQICFFLAIAIVFDIRDASYDLPSIRSIPQLIGERWTRVLAMLLMLVPVWMFAQVVLVENLLARDHVTDVPIRWTSIFALAGYIITALMLGRKAPERPFYHELVLDGLLILVPLLVWLGNLL